MTVGKGSENSLKGSKHKTPLLFHVSIQHSNLYLPVLKLRSQQCNMYFIIFATPSPSFSLMVMSGAEL